MTDEQSFSDAVVAAIRNGRKIDAIKLLREESGLGLKEAKEAVEAFVDRNPGMAGRMGPQGDSSFGRIVLIGIVVAAGIALYRFVS